MFTCPYVSVNIDGDFAKGQQTYQLTFLLIRSNHYGETWLY